MLEPEPDDSNMPRGRYGIYVGRERESRAIRAYLLDTRKVVVRNKFIPKEITPDIIAIINAIANQDPQIPLDSIIESESYKPVPISPTLNVAEIADVGRTFASEGVVNSYRKDLIKLLCCFVHSSMPLIKIELRHRKCCYTE